MKNRVLNRINYDVLHWQDCTLLALIPVCGAHISVGIFVEQMFKYAKIGSTNFINATKKKKKNQHVIPDAIECILFMLQIGNRLD